MEELLRSSAAYKIMSGDSRQNRLSHAYMLQLSDADGLRTAVKTFAPLICGEQTRAAIMRESYADMRIYPRPDKKLNADDAAEIVSESIVKPIAGERKVFLISNFETASPLFQNKLLKVLEEPPTGAYFILGTAQKSAVLPTVLSRVKYLEIAPFLEEQIKSGIRRLIYAGQFSEQEATDEKIAQAAAGSGGNFSLAVQLIRGGEYEQLRAAAEEICTADRARAGEVAAKYADFKYPERLLAEMQRRYFERLRAITNGEKGILNGENAEGLSARALVRAIERIEKGAEELNFNAGLGAMLNDILMQVFSEK